VGEIRVRVVLRKIGRYRLRKSASFNVFYDERDGMWCVENEELALAGYGSSYRKALKDLRDSLDSLLVGFHNIPEEKLSEKSKEIKHRLQEYIDLERFL